MGAFGLCSVGTETHRYSPSGMPSTHLQNQDTQYDKKLVSTLGGQGCVRVRGQRSLVIWRKVDCPPVHSQYLSGWGWGRDRPTAGSCFSSQPVSPGSCPIPFQDSSSASIS